MAKGTCWGQKTLQSLSYTNVALNILTDILFAVVIPVRAEPQLPVSKVIFVNMSTQIPMLWNVQMNKRQKWSIMGILGLGVL